MYLLIEGGPSIKAVDEEGVQLHLADLQRLLDAIQGACEDGGYDTGWSYGH